ncbi:cytochrome bd-I ubiquinol oxidase subunit CydA, partial [Vibrio sp. 10N.222.49.C9]
IKIPYVMGIIATRSVDKQVTGLRDLREEHVDRIRNGMFAYDLLEKLRAGDKSDANMAAFDEVKDDLGYGLLLKRYTDNVVDATETQIQAAADD